MFEGMAFQGRWRDYQQELLDQLAGHLADRRLHLVAAPGSGKTLLGLEVVHRLGKPALVLAPTIAIRNQWVARLCQSFLPPPGRQPDWVSIDPAAPAELTVATYQSLHAAAGREGGIEAVAAGLRALGAGVLVFDEAHHLRREWWQALSGLHAALDDAQIVSLTGTPPYDVEFAEWQRYEALCGPIDAEIPIPRLVRGGDLCPHQDYVHFSFPADADALANAHREAGFAAVKALLADAEMRETIADHPWLLGPDWHEKEIFAAPEFFSAMLVYLNATGAPLPGAALRKIGAWRSQVPAMSLGWLEVLLDGAAFAHADSFRHAVAWPKALRDRLRAAGLIEGRRVRLRADFQSLPALAGNLAKIDSIAEIARAESASLGEALRMVVLADYVRAEELPKRAGDAFRPAKLGVVPIFEALRRAAIPGARLGVLTGTLVIVPAAAEAMIAEAAAHAGIDAAHVRTAPLAADGTYLRLEVGGASGHRIVALVTRLFDRGAITLLVGTQSLLGEGWDAPVINTLVLASHVGSYMLSNQMRGRAIRTDPARPEKAANIWHLATIEPGTLGEALAQQLGWAPPMPPGDPVGHVLGQDMELLKRRFLAFEGVTHGPGGRIENGLGRLRLGEGEWDAGGVAERNRTMLARAAGRERLAGEWQKALDASGARRPRMREIMRPSRMPRTIVLLDTLQYMVVTALGAGLFAAAHTLWRVGFPGIFWLAIAALGGLALFHAAPRLAKALRLLLRNGSIERSIAQAGQAIVEALEWSGQLITPAERITVEAAGTLVGARLIRVEGATGSEERLILACLAELLGPIGNPRYLIVRESPLWRGRWWRVDYHAVPAPLGQKKETAEYFAERWRALVASGELVFLRSGAGRRLLLHARARSLSAGMQNPANRLSVWQ